MLASKRVILLMLISFTILFISYQLYLIFYPLPKVDADTRYVQLVDQYQVLKMERLVLEEQFALARTKQKVMKLASIIEQKQNIPAREKLLPSPNIASAHPLFIQQPISLSLDQAKTFQQLEAYVSNAKPSHSDPLTNDEKILLEASGSSFTLQLMGVRDANELMRFVAENHLHDAYIFHTYYLGKDWYVLVYGRYKNHTEALKAIEKLPQPILELKPWIRQLTSVQKAIQLYR